MRIKAGLLHLETTVSMVQLHSSPLHPAGFRNELCAAQVTFEKITFIARPLPTSQSAENSRNTLQTFRFKGNLF